MGMFEKPPIPYSRAEQRRKKAVGVKGNGENLDCYTCTYHAYSTWHEQVQALSCSSSSSR